MKEAAGSDNIKADLMDLLVYTSALNAEKMRCTPIEGQPDSIHATPLFSSLQKRVETVWAAVNEKLEASLGLPLEIVSLYDEAADGRRHVGYELRFKFTPGG